MKVPPPALHAERPAHGVGHLALLVHLGANLPELLHAEAVLLRLAAIGEIVFGDDLLGQRAAHALGDEDIFAEQFHAGLEVGLGLAVLADAHHAGDHAPDRAVLAVEHFGTGETRIDFHAQAFRLLRQPAADIAQRDGIVAVIVHQRRHQ